MIKRVACDSFRILSPRLRSKLIIQSRCYTTPTAPSGDGTTARVLNQEIGAGLMVDSYSQVGFRLNNGMSLFGPIVLFPKTVLSWRVDSAEEITEDSLSLFCLLEPKIDILVIGVGDIGNRINPRVLQYMRNKGINVEVLPTETACTTFNFLNDERRYVAAALIPPIALRPTGEDLVNSKVKYKKLFEADEPII